MTNRKNVTAEIPKGPRATLIGLRGEFKSREFLVMRSGIMLGRDPVACNIIFSDRTANVSRHHCLVYFNSQTGMFLIKDLNSKNGTYIQSGVPIHPDKPIAVHPGSRFWLGDENTMFELAVVK